MGQIYSAIMVNLRFVELVPSQLANHADRVQNGRNTKECEGDGQRAFDLLARYVDTPVLAQQCLRWAEEGLKARWIYVSEVEATYVTGEAQPIPA